jgi:hypothetical protein
MAKNRRSRWFYNIILPVLYLHLDLPGLRIHTDILNRSAERMTFTVVSLSVRIWFGKWWEFTFDLYRPEYHHQMENRHREYMIQHLAQHCETLERKLVPMIERETNVRNIIRTSWAFETMAKEYADGKVAK